MNEGFKGGKVPPKIVHEEFNEVDLELKSLFEKLRLVEQELKQTEDAIICEFIYNQSCFNSKYILSKKEVKDVFEFYIKYSAVVEELKHNKLSNIIKRKIKIIVWKIKKRKRYKQQLKEKKYE